MLDDLRVALSSKGMFDARDPDSLEARLKERAEERKKKRLHLRDPALPVVDASKFSQPLSVLAEAMTNLVEREGPRILTSSPIPEDTGIILRQLTHTYDLLRFINGDETRHEDSRYRLSYSFVCLPLVRTMIDGFYNCTALLDDRTRARSFRISGLYRKREALKADESKYGHEPAWQETLQMSRKIYEDVMRIAGFTDADLDDKTNRWPLLGEYLNRGPSTPHKAIIKRLTLGFWQQYSSISHASFDGLLDIFSFIAIECIPHEQRASVHDAAERHLGMHFARAAGLLLCLLTELQHFYKFDYVQIDERLSELWAAMSPVVEVKEFYDLRHKNMLRRPMP